MIKVLETVLPVLVMLLLGMFCRIGGFLEKKSIDNMKFLVTKIILPVAIFHALGTTVYSKKTISIVIIMFTMLLLSFGIGFLLKPWLKGSYQKYLPFMVSVYEGGMIAYPLYCGLCGNENLSQIAMLDIAGLLFGFSVYMGLLGQVENQVGIHAVALIKEAVKSPAFLATVLGIIVGTTGLLPSLVESAAGGVYGNVEDMLTRALSPLILLIVGYEMQPDMTLLKPCLKTIFLRVIVQAAMIVLVLGAIHQVIDQNMRLDAAVITYMSAPATFSMQSFLKEEKAGRYVSTTNSLYCFISIGVYVVLAAIYR
ncbi:AEC family transporter [Anaerosporobacter faecicola]|uniref:AEC family transporter n=1 Tax=Anaerosporobacter faecicola TaxID=2718714 RepID=UPI001EE5F56B|nr:AEC family transporter [Anaerosporobacter faecicola]